jgi:HTH-type transcriptional regulator, sugar sensing transcriptional regulator
MHMNLEILSNIGLTKGESRVYIALLKLGPSSVGGIIKEGRIARSKVYDVLHRLQEKGLVGSVKEGKIKKFSAVPPENLQQFLEKEKKSIEKKEEDLKEILPQLESIQPEKSSTGAEILSGPRGIRTFFDMCLTENPHKDEVLVIGYSKEASLYYHAYYRQWHKERIKLKIASKVVYDHETWNLKDRDKRTYVEQRYLPKGMKTPAFIFIFGDTVGTIVFTKEQKLCFMIKNKVVAKSYKDYFEIMWKQSIQTGK